MGEGEKSEESGKTENGSSWYKGWFFILRSGSPIAEQSGVYGLETLKNPSSINLAQNTLAPSMEDFDKPPGVYITQRTHDELKFIRQRNSIAVYINKCKLNPLVIRERDLEDNKNTRNKEMDWESFKEGVAESFRGAEEVCIDYAKLFFKDASIAYVVLGVNYNNSITAEDYEDILTPTNVVKSVVFGREHLDTKKQRETLQENKDLNTHDMSIL